MRELNEILEEIKQIDKLSFDDSFRILKECSYFLLQDENKCRKIVINILDNWYKLNNETHEMWITMIEAIGYYPYLDKEKFNLNSLSQKIRKEFHASQNLDSKYFHEEQKILVNKLNEDTNLIVSAPTSFGKSLLIEEIVASNKYSNIVIIQPTLALLDETRKKLRKYKDDYKIIIRTSQKPSEEKKNLFLLTAERVMEYEYFPKIDFFIIDEFYKLSNKRDDERADVLNNSFNMLINKFNSKFYLLGPNIDNISEGFTEKYNSEFFKTNFSLVEVEKIDVYSEYKEKFDRKIKEKEFKEKVLFDLLINLKNEQTIIYCSSPASARKLSKKFLDYLTKQKIKIPKRQLTLIEWINKNINKNWSLVKCLKNGIGIHDGALQKHITSSIIEYFNEKKLNYLFCTSTIIEGVNTSAKNVVFFDNTKGNRKPIDFFDYSNIKGRAGRMMEHYIGRIFDFNSVPEEEEIVVDIPFFEQNPISDEILIQLAEKDIIDKNSEQYKEITKYSLDERKLFKKNGVSIKGQKKILDTLRQEIEEKHNKIYWNTYPTYKQLTYILLLGWDNLIKVGETTRPMTKGKLIHMTYNYGLNKNIFDLVKGEFEYLKDNSKGEKTNDELLDLAIVNVFQTLRHWFQYKVPKWLQVINEIQKFVCEEKKLESGNYTFYATQIENDFLRENLSLLMEIGIPKSAINKIEKYIPNSISQDNVLDYIKKEKIIDKSNLLEYEKEKIISNF